MKIAIPVSQGLLCSHFGHCDRFAIIDIDDNGAVVAQTEAIPPPHEPGVIPRWLKTLDVNHVIAGGMGGRAQAIFVENGISVSIGAPCMEPAALATAYKKGELTLGDNMCDH